MSSVPVAFAQRAQRGFELTGLYGYQLSPSFDAETEYGSDLLVKLGDSPTYGVVAGRLLRPGVRGEFSWRYQPTHVDVAGAGEDVDFDLYMHHFNLAVSYERGNPRVQGFAVVGLGAAVAHPEESYDDSWFISFQLGLGLKFRLTELLGIRAESRMSVPIRLNEGGMWCTNLGGCVAVVTDAKAIAQFDFVAGPVLSF